MSGRRTGRGVYRSDDQVLAHAEDVELLRAVAAGAVTTRPDNRMDLRRLAREDLILAGFGVGTTPVMLPRGREILAVANGELPSPLDHGGEV